MNIVELRGNLADTLNRVAYGHERIVLERRGKGVAVLVSMDDLATLQALEDAEDVRVARKRLKEKGGKTLDHYKAERGMK